ncbi:PREDICTED: SAP domain-containing ribonucleoprotein-like [Amphimedon queenslandica]|uniref:SAP domain-containing protein n=1 Tax=Amphimedon queenslandica TaxID=400682 RepID=A0A1X7VRU2_AMPQE|nr:PREDICTED: SAP domain-containing ribonucleoprotein-like [Amphimedon queenslandica]|eukprot:XP_003383137.1 PREDICTED: SAP domain-containing ribonucleoprotein-like [Amphimedon queenslandica]
MADDEDHEEELVDIDITEWKKFKVAELRQRMGSIGLDTKGTKAELIARVEKYLNEQEADDLLEEEEEEGEGGDQDGLQEESGGIKENAANPVETTGNAKKQNQSQASSTENKVINIEYQLPPPGQPVPVVTETPPTTAKLSDNDRLKKRGERFGVTDNAMAKKLKRAERFGTVLGKRGGAQLPAEDVEKMKKRAQRFGSAGGSPIINQLEDNEKKKSRAARFNLSATDLATEDRKANRAERFGTII